MFVFSTILAWREQFTREIALPPEPEPMPGHLYQRLMRGHQDPREPLEQVRPDQINPEQVFPDQINLEQVFPGQINQERGGLGQADLGQLNLAYHNPGEALHHDPGEAGDQVHEVGDYRQYEDFPAQYEDFPAELPPQVFHADEDLGHERVLLRIEGDPAAVMVSDSSCLLLNLNISFLDFSQHSGRCRLRPRSPRPGGPLQRLTQPLGLPASYLLTCLGPYHTHLLTYPAFLIMYPSHYLLSLVLLFSYVSKKSCDQLNTVLSPEI